MLLFIVIYLFIYSTTKSCAGNHWADFFFIILGFSGIFRSYGGFESSENCILQPQDEEISTLRQQFEAAKQSFLKIPNALKEMPKMNPEGSFQLFLALVFYCFYRKLNWMMFVWIGFLGIYVNKNLRLDRLQVYGFDYDYTLAHYSDHLQTLIYDLAKEYMVNEVSFWLQFFLTHSCCFGFFPYSSCCFFQLRYPDVCMGFTYDPTFPIRGLYYDKSKGCLMKLDFFGSIEPDGCYFGRRRVLDIVSLYFILRFIYMQHQVSYCCHFDFVLNFLCKITHNLNCVGVVCIEVVCCWFYF